jgi:hypothetical protein
MSEVSDISDFVHYIITQPLSGHYKTGADYAVIENDHGNAYYKDKKPSILQPHTWDKLKQ